MCEVWFDMVLKKEIEDDAFFAFRKTQQNVLNTNRIDCIHVSDLIKECMRLPVLNKVKPIVGLTTEASQKFYLGQLVHNQSDMSNVVVSGMKGNEIPLLYNWVTDESVDGDTFHGIHPSTKYDYIAGSIDDLRKIGDDYIICDKKTSHKIENKVKYGPSDENKLQLNMYRVLLWKNYGIDAKWGCNVFVDINPESPRGIVHPVAYRLKPMEDTLDLMVQNAEVIKDACLGGDLPPATRCFMCDGFCPHATFCFGEKK